MNYSFPALRIGLIGVLCLLSSPALIAQETKQELEVVIEALQRQNAILRQQLLDSEERQATPLHEALAAANLEAEKFRQLYTELLIKVDSLGLESLGSEEALRDRTVKAISEITAVKEQKELAETQLLKLSEVVIRYLKSSTSDDVQTRVEIEAELRAADEVLGFAAVRGEDEEETGGLGDAKVIAFKDELQLAVLNVGKVSGVRIGMPMNVFRKDRLIGSVVVVDVRDSICGVLVQEIYTQGDRIQVQDRAEPRTGAPVDL